MTNDPRVAPDIAALLSALRTAGVQFVLAGSVAVQAWGVDVGTPGDLDIVPSLEPANLERLASVLVDVGAEAWPATGAWAPGEKGEHRWVKYADDDPRRGMRPVPDPADGATFDTLFATRHGELDVVPHIGGTYESLLPRAATLPVHGVPEVRVTSIADLLARLTVPRRPKDVPRVAALRARQLPGF